MTWKQLACLRKLSHLEQESQKFLVIKKIQALGYLFKFYSRRQMNGRVKSHIFNDTLKQTPRLSTNLSSQTRKVLLPNPLFVVGWKKKSKHFFFRYCYTNFRPFARKSRLCTRVVGHKILICGQTNKNEYSSTGANIAQNCFSNLHVFFQVSNPKKIFSRGPVCH